jgi:hypothetical protein
MKHYALGLAIACAVLAGFAGAARAQLNESPMLSTQSPGKADRLVPMPRPQPPIASRRIPEQMARTASQLQPICGWLTCSQYLIVGIGF